MAYHDRILDVNFRGLIWSKLISNTIWFSKNTLNLSNFGSNLGTFWKINPFMYQILHLTRSHSYTRRLNLLPMLKARPCRAFRTENPLPIKSHLIKLHWAYCMWPLHLKRYIVIIVWIEILQTCPKSSMPTCLYKKINWFANGNFQHNLYLLLPFQ